MFHAPELRARSQRTGYSRCVPKDDPGELFDVCDEEGRPLGRSRPRALVHRDGDWHRSVHVWVLLTGQAVPSVVLQRRSLTKDSHPGMVDVSVAGHLRAGEAPVAALREAEEEIGLALAAPDVVRLGRRRRIDAQAPLRVDREVQEIFYTTTTRTLDSLRPDADEVLGLLEVALPDAIALCRGDVPEVPARELRAGGAGVALITLRREELLASPDAYFSAALAAIARRLAGHVDEELAVGAVR